MVFLLGMDWGSVSDVFSSVDGDWVDVSRGFSWPFATMWLDLVYVLLLVGLMVEVGLLVVLRGIGFLVFVLSRRVGLGLGLDLDEAVLLGVLGCFLDGARVCFVGAKLASSELLGSGSAMLNESSFRDWFLSRRSGRRFWSWAVEIGLRAREL